MNSPQVSPLQSLVETGDDVRSMLDVAKNRVVAEVQSAVVLAKKFPRDEPEAFQRIMKACQRPTLAESALYAYPRGGKTVTGESIRLVEEMARNWRNLRYGVHELEQRNGESIALSFAWDIENNIWVDKVFTVPHKRYTKDGTYDLSDPRDIYEAVANNGARRVRACLLQLIPIDVREAAVEAVKATLKKGDGRPLEERIKTMIAAFEKDFHVSKAQIEAFLGHKVEATIEEELVNLKAVYRSVRDGFKPASAYFSAAVTARNESAPSPSEPGTPSANDLLGGDEPKEEPKKDAASSTATHDGTEE